MQCIAEEMKAAMHKHMHRETDVYTNNEGVYLADLNEYQGMTLVSEII